jgi:hypothetical protein
MWQQQFLCGVNPVEDNCFDTLVYLSVYHLTVTIISQKYQELSLQVEISE